MLSNISPLRPNPRDDATSKSDRTKPQGQPRDDGFRKTMNDRRPNKEDEELASAAEEKEDTPSLFDLSKSSKPKSKSNLSGKSNFKDSDSSTVTKNPVNAKQGQDQGEESSQDQELGQTSRQDASKMTSTEKAIPGKTPPSQEKLSPTAKTEAPPETPEAPPAAEKLTSGQEASKPPLAQAQQTQIPLKKPMDQAAAQQPADALKQGQAAAALQQPQKGKVAKEEESSVGSEKLGSTSKKQKTGKSEEGKSETGEVKGDAAAATAVNSSIQSTGFQTEKAQESQETVRSETIRELATQIVDRIQVMRKGDETQTTITLRQPPVLEGATITLTTTDNAKREFNIAFANLTPEAKLLLDRKLKEDPLTDSLERKGITVHMLTTSTQAEPTFTVDAGQASRDRQDQQQQQQEQQQRRQKFQPSEDEEVT